MSEARLARVRRGTVALRAICLVILLAVSALGQVRPTKPEPVTEAQKAAIIDSISTGLQARYVYPDVAKRMMEFVRKQQKSGAYKEIGTNVEFARALTTDLRSISKDRHLGVGIDPNPMVGGDSLTDAQKAQFREEQRRRNWAFQKVEILPGNIGYLDLRNFMGAEDAEPTAAAAMAFLENADALIFDLRQNGGGDPSMIQLLSSYLFDTTVHLNSFAERGSDSIRQYWTTAYVPGKRRASTPVYILTSKYTFSAAEEFTYNLKNLKRATVIGETTGGGAHPVEEHQFANLHVVLRVPYARAINPVTGTNWEGVGVKPDIDVPADKALGTAQMTALKTLAEKAATPERKAELQWFADDAAAETNPTSLNEADLAAYAGVYGVRTISVENGALYSQRQGGSKLRLLPMGNDLFRFDLAGSDMRLRFQRDGSNAVAGVTAVFMDGHEEAFSKEPIGKS